MWATYWGYAICGEKPLRLQGFTEAIMCWQSLQKLLELVLTNNGHVKSCVFRGGSKYKVRKECMNTEYIWRVLGALTIYCHFCVISILGLQDSEHQQCEDLPHFSILYRTPGVDIAPLMLEAIEIAPLSPTPAPSLGSREHCSLGLLNYWGYQFLMASLHVPRARWL